MQRASSGRPEPGVASAGRAIGPRRRCFNRHVSFPLRLWRNVKYRRPFSRNGTASTARAVQARLRLRYDHSAPTHEFDKPSSRDRAHPLSCFFELKYSNILSHCIGAIHCSAGEGSVVVRSITRGVDTVVYATQLSREDFLSRASAGKLNENSSIRAPRPAILAGWVQQFARRNHVGTPAR